MSYQVLARKWRPKNFETLAGQEHVLRALKNALDQNRLHHAYLFTGTRGVGKTTIARIIAKALNCEKGITSTPCGKCSACTEIDAGHFIDLIEVDAASRTKVEDTRELLDNVQYAPTRGRFKIYLIDEVHMLSGHSFNALLKTLEEPPPHVKFLLATTDPQKLPVTVLSRCLQFHLKNLPIERIQDYLSFVLNEETISFEPAALLHIARAANGSMRDALSLLDQAIAYGQGNIKTAEITQMLGTIEQDAVTPLLDALIDHNGLAVLAHIKHLAESSVDFANVLEELLSTLHQVAIVQHVPEAINPHLMNQASIKNLASRLSQEDVQLYYQIALTGKKDLPLAPDAQMGFEMLMLRMLSFQPAEVSTPQQTATPAKPQKPAAPTENQTPKQPAPTTTPKTPPPSHNGDWPTIASQLKLSGMTQLLIDNCTLQSLEDNKIALILNQSHAAMYSDRLKPRLEEALSLYFDKSMKLTITIGQSDQQTPAELLAQGKKEKKDQAVAALKSDPRVKNIISTFDATLHTESVEARE
jgi:DNA polymerase III subunit gamma/tau